MKTLNIFPIDWNSPDCVPERTWIIPNERDDNFNWVTGMFHETITNKINLDLNYNQLEDINQIKKLSDKNIPYNIFVKFYQFRHLVGVDVDNETIKDELSFFYHYLKDDKSKFIIDDIRLGKCKLIFASLTEFSNEDYHMYFTNFKNLLKQYDILEENVLIFDYQNNMESLNKKYETNIKFKYYNWLMVAWQHYLKLPDTQSNFKNKNYIRDKYYMTLNKSVTKQHRLYLMYFLWNSNLLDKGFVSFFHEKDSEQYKEQFFDGLVGKLSRSKTQKFYNWLNDNPLYVDVNWQELKEYSQNNQMHSSAPNEVFIDKTDNAYKNSYFNILTESSFVESDIEGSLDFYLNERNVFPINAFQPYIAVNGQGHMKELKKLWFKTFHPHIDESYDEEISANKRFSMIETEIDKLCSMSKQEIHDWYWSMEEIYKYNYNHLHNVFYPTQIKGFFDEFIFE